MGYAIALLSGLLFAWLWTKSHPKDLDPGPNERARIWLVKFFVFVVLSNVLTVFLAFKLTEYLSSDVVGYAIRAATVYKAANSIASFTITYRESSIFRKSK